MIEPFIVAPVILGIGVAFSFAIRWIFTTTHWLTWLPTIVLAIPFMVFYGFIPVMAVVTELQRWRKA